MAQRPGTDRWNQLGTDLGLADGSGLHINPWLAATLANFRRLR